MRNTNILEVQQFDMPKMIPLNKALLCLDCETIFDKVEIGGRITCPACGSKFYRYISKFLNREG